MKINHSSCPLNSSSSGLLFGLIALFYLTTAHASPVFEQFGDAIGTAGFSAGFSTPGAASTYFNPAMLPRLRHGEVGGGVLVIKQRIAVELGARVAQNDVEWSVLTAKPGPGQTHTDAPNYSASLGTIPTAILREGCSPGAESATPVQETPLVCNGGGRPPMPRQGAGTGERTLVYTPVGLVVPLIDDDLVFGFYGIMSTEEFNLQGTHVDEYEQFFTNSLHPELYGDRMTAQAISFGFGSQLGDMFSFGLSFSLDVQTQATANSFIIDGANQDEGLVLSTNVDTKTGMSPHFGVTFTPSDTFALSAVVHSSTSFGLQTEILNDTSDGERTPVSRSQANDWMPTRWEFGADWGGDEGMNVRAGLKWSKWSEYVDRQGVTPSGAYAWANTVTPTLGLRYQTLYTTYFSDFRYVKSPVPEQTGRTNYVDNDRVDLVGGVAQSFDIGGLLFRATANVRGTFFHRRTNTKIVQQTADPGIVDETLVIDEFPDGAASTARGSPLLPESNGLQTNNPGFPSFASTGILAGGGLSLALLF